MLIASPDVMFLTTRRLYEENNYVYMDCTYSWPESNTKMYQLCIVTLLFAGPFVLMSISYSHIVNVLWRNETMTDTLQHSFQLEEEQQLPSSKRKNEHITMSKANHNHSQRKQQTSSQSIKNKIPNGCQVVLNLKSSATPEGPKNVIAENKVQTSRRTNSNMVVREQLENRSLLNDNQQLNCNEEASERKSSVLNGSNVPEAPTCNVAESEQQRRSASGEVQRRISLNSFDLHCIENMVADTKFADITDPHLQSNICSSEEYHKFSGIKEAIELQATQIIELRGQAANDINIVTIVDAKGGEKKCHPLATKLGGAGTEDQVETFDPLMDCVKVFEGKEKVLLDGQDKVVPFSEKLEHSLRGAIFINIELDSKIMSETCSREINQPDNGKNFDRNELISKSGNLATSLVESVKDTKNFKNEPQIATGNIGEMRKSQDKGCCSKRMDVVNEKTAANSIPIKIDNCMSTSATVDANLDDRIESTSGPFLKSNSQIKTSHPLNCCRCFLASSKLKRDKQVSDRTSKKYRENLANYAAKQSKYNTTSSIRSTTLRMSTNTTSSLRPFDDPRKGCAKTQHNLHRSNQCSRPLVRNSTLTSESLAKTTYSNLNQADVAVVDDDHTFNGIASLSGNQFNQQHVSYHTRFCKLIESRKKAAKMLIVIVIMFGLCYLPIHFLNTLR